VNFCILETNPKTTSFHMYIVYQRNKLFMGKYLFLYLYFIFNIWGRKKILMIKRGHEWKKFKKRYFIWSALHWIWVGKSILWDQQVKSLFLG